MATATKTIRLPKELVTEVSLVKDEVDPQIYGMLCSLVVALDDDDLLDDQLCVSLFDDDHGDVEIEWPRYGIYFDIRRDEQHIRFKLHQPKTKILASLPSYEDVETLLSSVLEMEIDKTDPNNPYRKDKRTLENTVECVRGRAF